MNIKPAQITLNALNDGHTMNELAQHIHDVTAAVRAHGKPGEVKLTIKIAPVSGVAHGLVESPIVMVAEVASKLPKDLPSTLFYVDEDGNPTRNAPERQPEIQFTVHGKVDKTTGEISNG